MQTSGTGAWAERAEGEQWRSYTLYGCVQQLRMDLPLLSFSTLSNGNSVSLNVSGQVLLSLGS